MSKKVIATDKAPAAVASYSQAIRAHGFVFCSGQVPLDPDTQELVGGSVADETRRCLQNLNGVLEAAGAGWDDVVKVNAYLVDMGTYAEFNEAYSEFVGSEPPARAAVGVAALPLGARIEIECVAYRPEG